MRRATKVIINHFTQFMQVYATTSKSSKTVADHLFNDFALRFGFPSQIHCVECGVSPGVKVAVNDSESDDEYCIQFEQYQFRTQNSQNQMEKETVTFNIIWYIYLCQLNYHNVK